MPLTPQQIADKVPELARVNNDGFLELFANNSILSSMRKCEAFFVERYINKRVPVEGKNWNLSFGSWLHESIEELYRELIKGNKLTLDDFLHIGIGKWNALEIESYKDEKSYIQFGGIEGAMVILGEFYNVWYGQDHLEIISVETSFGYGKEVPIISPTYPEDRFFPFNAYLCGRPDIIVHNGRSIGVLDWKTTAYFDGYEHLKYKPYDALQGYIYGLKHIILNKYPELLKKGLTIDTAWVICISKRVTKTDKERFKRFPVSYTPSELLEYRNRQVESFSRLYDILANNRQPQWNTELCGNDWYHPCQYRILHSISPEQREAVLNGRFTTDTSGYKPDNSVQESSE